MRALRLLLLLAALATAGAVTAALAAGATPTSPEVTTAAATGVTDTAATLQGAVNPEGQQTQYAFQWGPTAGYGHETPLTSAGSGSAVAPVNAPVGGLSPGSTYHFRVIAMNPSGVTVGADQAFTTTGTAPSASPSPTASTGAATNLTQSSARVMGTVNPHGQATSYYFEYGTTSDYGIETAPAGAGSGTSDVTATANITGLAANTTYHYRVVAVSPGGTALGADETVRTATAPGVSTGNASGVRKSSAVLNGIVNPEGWPTQFFFRFGTTAAYGLQTRPVSTGLGTDGVAVHREITALASGTTYHYQLVAASAGGTSYGVDRTVKTSGPAERPSRIGVLGRMGFVSRGGWIGVVIGCFGGQTRCSGHFELTQGHAVIGQRNFNISTADGRFQNVRLSAGARHLFGRSYHGPVLVEVTAVSTSGQRISEAMHLARWR